MFSAKFNFLKTIISTIASGIDGISTYLTLDYAHQGQPFVNIIPSSGVITTNDGLSNLDYVYKGSPFNGNDSILLNSSNPVITPSTVETSDPYLSNVVLLIRGSGIPGGTGIIDRSSYNHSITLPTAGGPNNTAFSSGSYIFNTSSIIFDGDYDYLQLPTSTNLDFGTDPFTIEFWMKTNGSQDADSKILSNYSDTTELLQINNSSATDCFLLRNSGVGIGTYALSTMNNGNWHHIAMTRTGTSGIYTRFYIDGFLTGFTTSHVGLSGSMSGGRIGRAKADDLNTNNYNGYLDEIRFTKGICRYDTTTNFDFTAPTGEFPEGSSDPYWDKVSLLLHFNGNDNTKIITDSSPKPKNVTAGGSSIISTTQSKFGGSSASFPDVSSLTAMSIPANTDFAFGIDDFTCECWLYLTSYSQVYRVFGTQNAFPNFDFAVHTNGQMRFGVSTTDVCFFGKPNSVPINEWTHLAWDRLSLTMKAYVNGNLIGAAYVPTNLANNQIIEFPVAIYGDKQPSYIDELRITKGIARYSSSSKFITPRLRFAGA
jgi:hypothetical protein